MNAFLIVLSGNLDFALIRLAAFIQVRKSGQFEDSKGEAERILPDRDRAN